MLPTIKDNGFSPYLKGGSSRLLVSMKIALVAGSVIFTNTAYGDSFADLQSSSVSSWISFVSGSTTSYSLNYANQTNSELVVSNPASAYRNFTVDVGWGASSRLFIAQVPFVFLGTNDARGNDAWNGPGVTAVMGNVNLPAQFKTGQRIPESPLSSNPASAYQAITSRLARSDALTYLSQQNGLAYAQSIAASGRAYDRTGDYGGVGGEVDLTLHDISVTGSVSAGRVQSYMDSTFPLGYTPWAPAAFGVLAGSYGGNGGASAGKGGEGGVAQLNLNNAHVSLTAYYGDQKHLTVVAGATSVGGQAGMCCLSDQNNQNYQRPLEGDIASWNQNNYTFDSPVPYANTKNWYLTEFGSNAAGSTATVALTKSSVTTSGNYVVGVSATSVGGAIQILPELVGGGVWDTHWAYGGDSSTNGDYPNGLNGGLNDFPRPGKGGAATVQLQDSTVDLSGKNILGILAASATQPFFIPTNTLFYKGDVPAQGDVTVTIDKDSKVKVIDSSFSGASFGVTAISTGSSTILPFGNQHYLDATQMLERTPASVGTGGDVSVDHAGTMVVKGKSAVGIAAVSSSTGGIMDLTDPEKSNPGFQSPLTGGGAGDVTVTNSGNIAVDGDHGIGIAAISSASGGLMHSLPSTQTGSEGADTGDSIVVGDVGQRVGVRFIGSVRLVGEPPNYQMLVAQSDLAGQDKIWPMRSEWDGDSDESSTIGFYEGSRPEDRLFPARVSGGSVQVTNTGLISVGSDRNERTSYGIIAQSIGGGGGTTVGGSPKSLGDSGGVMGGDGGSVTVTNSGRVLSKGNSAVGILAQSIGGGGGAGANSDSAFVALGGAGGNGGNGGLVTIKFEDGSSSITNGDYAVGVLAHSIGGGGGHGGAAMSWGLFTDTGIGGSGGNGGDGGNISFESQGKDFWTAGQHAHGLVLQSIGGGGGAGGAANAVSVGLIFSVSVAVGGSGGDGGDGGNINTVGIANTNAVTNAHDSAAIILQSIGGGGGMGGAATAKSYAIGLGTFDPELAAVPSVSVSIALGGSGGKGGVGGDITYRHRGNLATYGNGSHGILAQSIGGGGGSGADATAMAQTVGTAETQIDVSVGLGGSAGNGSHGGDVTVTLENNSAIVTRGHDAVALLAQSIGGGGGNAGVGSGVDLSVQFTPKEEAPNDETLGQAGNDDVGDLSDFDDLPSSSADDVSNDVSSTAGETSGSVADMSDFDGLNTDGVAVPSTAGEEKTMWASGLACLKKVLKTSSLRSALGDCDEDDPDKPSAKTVTLDIDVGKSGGSGALGGTVNATVNPGYLITTGANSPAVLAQSVGGQGGRAAASGADALGGKLNMTVDVGGTGGSGANGGVVTVSLLNSPNVTTGLIVDLSNPAATDVTSFKAPLALGGGSHGVHAQSIGGGGGIGGNADPSSSFFASALLDLAQGKYETATLRGLGLSQDDINDLTSGVALLQWGLLGQAPTAFSFSPQVTVGGSGGSGGNGNTVQVTQSGVIRTFGHRSFGIFAQSIGGGGGEAGTANGALIDLSASETLSGISFNPSINVGGSGGAGGNGAQVSVLAWDSPDSTLAKAYSITTHGYASYGVLAQSIGGGGGIAHEASTFGLSDEIGVSADVDVTGGVDFGNGQSNANYTATANNASKSGSIQFGTQSSETVSGNSGTGGLVRLGTSDSWALSGSLTTHGNEAVALFGQSIGGGGGVATLGCSNRAATESAHYASACWGNTAVDGSTGQPNEFVGGAGNRGVDITVNGGNAQSDSTGTGSSGVVVYSRQRITTYGDRSMGIVAQSITGGGGFFSGPNRRIHSVTMPTQQRASDNSPGSTTISLAGSTITTHGDGAWGVFAQMVQGGGGFFGDSSQDLAFNVKPSQNGNPSSDVFAKPVNNVVLPSVATGDSWSNNPITVSLTEKTHIITNGKNAHGMVLQNLGSVGGVWSSSGSKLNMGITLNGANAEGNTPGGKVSLTLYSSYIDANGEGARGVVIQSDGAGPGGNADQGQVTVNINNQSRIYSAKHTALTIVGGSYSTTTEEQNTVNVNKGTIQSGAYMAAPGVAMDNSDSAYNMWAVYAPTGYTNINLKIGGSIWGNVLLGIVTKGDFNVEKDASWHGSTAIVAADSLHNYGTIYAGGEGATGGLFIDGSLKHYEGGEIHVDLHPLGDAESHDVITVTGLARIEGEIVPQTKSLLPGNYQFLTAGALEHSGSVRDSHVFDWNETINGNVLTKTPTARFVQEEFHLTDNQLSLAGYLQRGWDSGEREKGYLFGYLHEHDDGAHGDYQATLDQLMGQTLNAQPIQFQTAFSTYMSESLSCPTVTEQGLRLNQDNCAWAKVTGDISDQSSNSSNPGFRATGGGIRLGAQKSLGDGWSAGFGAGYALNYLTSTNFSSNGQFLDLSVSAKKQIEQWEFGGSLGYAQGWFQNNRYRAMGANGAADAMDGVFASDSRMSIMGLRLRAAYEHELDKDHYLKPYVDVDLSYSSMPGYSETGTAPLALNVGSSSRWNVAITPMLEYGLDVITEDKSRVKLFASAGASFLPNNSHKSETSFAGVSAALGTFDVITDGPEILGRLNLGIQAFHSDDLEVRAQYGLLAGDGYWSQSLSANLVWRF